MRKIKMLRKYVSREAGPLAQLLNTLNILSAFLGIPALIIHELSHLFFILLFRARWGIGEFCFLKPGRNPEGKLALKTCVQFGISPRRYWHGIVIGISPLLATIALITSTFYMPLNLAWPLRIYIFAFFGTFRPSVEDVHSIIQCWQKQRQGGNIEKQLAQMAQFAKDECGITTEDFFKEMKADPKALVLKLRKRTEELKAELDERIQRPINTREDMDAYIAELKRKIHERDR